MHFYPKIKNIHNFKMDIFHSTLLDLYTISHAI